MLRQLRGATFDDDEPVLSGPFAERLPYANPWIDVLPVVLIADAAGAASFAPRHSVEVGAPYVLTCSSLADGAVMAAWGIAKGIGKLLGLGEEGTHPELLAAPGLLGSRLPEPVHSAVRRPHRRSAVGRRGRRRRPRPVDRRRC